MLGRVVCRFLLRVAAAILALFGCLLLDEPAVIQTIGSDLRPSLSFDVSDHLNADFVLDSCQVELEAAIGADCTSSGIENDLSDLGSLVLAECSHVPLDELSFFEAELRSDYFAF